MASLDTIQLNITSSSQGGVTTANLLINGHDTGILYLTEQERELFVSVLDRGRGEDVKFEVNGLQEEIDIDIFED